MKSIIFDLDGTLALIDDRRTLSTKDNGKIDWDIFFDPNNINLDKPEKENKISNKISNNFIVGYTYNNEDRGSYGEMFPLIEILRNGASYIAAGFEPFTPSNKLNYKTFQMSDNLSFYLGKHTISTGFNVENLSFGFAFLRIKTTKLVIRLYVRTATK